jgi:hypothetical protein
MGILDGLLGNASQVDKGEVARELRDILIPNEEVDMAYKIIRDMLVFTDKRLIIVDKQGITGKKIEYHTIPYKSIVHFSTETMGTFDLDAELKIWVSGSATPITKSFKKDGNITEVQKVLAMYLLK